MIWIDAQLSPDLALWLKESFDLEAKAVRDVGLRDAKDREIYESAMLENAIVMIKDSDFVVLLDELGPLRKFCGLLVAIPRMNFSKKSCYKPYQKL